MSTPKQRKKNIDFDGLDIVVDGTDTNVPPMRYSLCDIKSVEPLFNDATAVRSMYPYSKMLIVTIHFTDGQGGVSKLSFDIQDVQNQAGWTANFAGLLQCVADIANARLNSCSATNSEASLSDIFGLLESWNVGRMAVSASKTYLCYSEVSTSAPAYTAGDQIGGVITFTDVALLNGGSGKITGARMYLKDNTGHALELEADLILFSLSPTSSGDNNTYSMAAGNVPNFIGVVQFKASEAIAVGVPSIYKTAIPNAIGFNTDSGSRDIYGILVARNAYSANSKNVGIILDIEQNFE